MSHTTMPSPAEGRNTGSTKRVVRETMWGLLFIGPNLLGFLTFTAVPLVISMFMAFTNWDLKLHNQFKVDGDPINLVGLENFIRLFQSPDFLRFLGNTLFFMIGMPFSIAASLGAAILLSLDLRGGSSRVWAVLLATSVAIASALMLVSVGMGASAMTIMLAGLAGMILILGVTGGTTAYRTLFYVPHFTSGVATFLLWKKLYDPKAGPITTALTGPLDALTAAVRAAGSPVAVVLAGLLTLVAGWLLVSTLRKISQAYADGEMGLGALIMGMGMVLLPVVLCLQWFGVFTGHLSSVLPYYALTLGCIGLAAVLYCYITLAGSKDIFPSKTMEGVGGALMLGGGVTVGILILMGLAATVHLLPVWAAKPDGLLPPDWLTDYNWAKPSIMIMGFWGAIGSNTMLLYLAALTNVPQELYEAADIDGASKIQKFWNVTWPQLAPTTFFIVVMGVIGGLQGGFEMARVMTYGGPAGSTTTLAYYIYTEGFETGRLGFSSAVAWTLFLMVLIVTLFNWKFGNKYVND